MIFPIPHRQNVYKSLLICGHQQLRTLTDYVAEYKRSIGQLKDELELSRGCLKADITALTHIATFDDESESEHSEYLPSDDETVCFIHHDLIHDNQLHIHTQQFYVLCLRNYKIAQRTKPISTKIPPIRVIRS